MSDDRGAPGTESTTDDPERDSLELEKLRCEITELKKAPRRAAISTAATILLGVATIFLGIAGLIFNKTIGDAAEQQRAFDNYTKLTEAFAKPGPPKIAAVVGFRDFVAGDSNRARQTTAILTNDLFVEKDPLVVEAVDATLRSAGMSVFDEVRAVNAAAHYRLQAATYSYFMRKASAAYSKAARADSGLDWRAFSHSWAVDARIVRDAQQELTLDAAQSFDRLNVRTMVQQSQISGPSGISFRTLSRLNDIVDITRPEITREIPLFGPVADTTTRSTRDAFAREVQGLLLTSEILRFLLEGKNANTIHLAAPGLAVFDVAWDGKEFPESILTGSLMQGSARGADFSNADLSNSVIDANIGPSASHRTSFCGANLSGAVFTKLPQDQVLHGDPRIGDIPDFTGANWWEIRDLAKNTASTLEAVFPRRAQETLYGSSHEVKLHVCQLRWLHDDRIASPMPRSP